jgi:hypothetical protein
MAYQSSNNTKNSGTGSLYSDICSFAFEISRERNAIASRAQAEAARKRQQHRQELLEAREYAAAQALNSLKDSGPKARFPDSSTLFRGLTNTTDCSSLHLGL